MKILLFTIAVLMNISAFAQSDFDESKDAKTGQKIYNGQFTFENLLEEKSFTWMKKGFDSYRPDTTTMKYLKKHLGGYKMVIMIGTWCDDSHDLVPRLYKVLTLAGYPMDKYSMFGANREKEVRNQEHKFYNVINVPTIILYRDNYEKGRIVETVNKSIEADLAKIIEDDLKQKTQKF